MKPIAAKVGEGGRRHLFWLNNGFGMMASPQPGAILEALNFGGVFTSVPAAIVSMARHKLDTDPTIATDNAGFGLITERTDIFGLGLDYGMYHKVFWGSYNQNDFYPWLNLGGIFTSAPAAVAWKPNQEDHVDVFGVGLDHAMYTKTRIAEGDWATDWLSLGGDFTSSASVLTRKPSQIELFARGGDFTLRHNQNGGSGWFGWQNLGGKLASPPVAISWGPDRMDVFAIFNDGALNHRWWDGQIWNDWESLGGSYVGEPAVASSGLGRLDVIVVGGTKRILHHYAFHNNTWSHPQPIDHESVVESPVVISAGPNVLEVFTPDKNGHGRTRIWDGHNWQFGMDMVVGDMRVPSRYRFSVDLIKAKTPRSLLSDTDAAALSLAVGNWPSHIKTQWIGDIGGPSHPEESQTNLLEFEDSVDLAEAVSFGYLVVNNGHAAEDKILTALQNAGDSLNLASVASMSEDIAKKIVNFVSVKLTALLTINVPVVGTIAGTFEQWLLSKLTNAIFESCDGIVSIEFRPMMGRELFVMTDNGKKRITFTTIYHGTESPSACGAKSEYEVTWTIKPL
jgi:Repeat of unknown function (DUF346)